MKKEKVSVIIPVHNVEDYLSRCIDSVINQTHDNIEIILVDDGSTDNSQKICDDYSKKDNRVFFKRIKPCNCGQARNIGLEEAKGDYILFLDSDDYIEYNTIERMLNEIKKGYDIVCCGFDRIDEDTKKVYCTEMISMPYDEIILNDDNFMEASFLSPSCWGKLFPKELLSGSSFTTNAIEDILFYIDYIPKVKKIKFVKEVLWHYMVKKVSGVTSFNVEKANHFEEDLLKLKEKYNKNNYSIQIKKFLTLQAIIHDCISIPSRLYNNKNININDRITHIKKYMDDNFEDWKNIKIRVKGRTIKKFAIHVILLMYRLNIIKIFLFFYNFIINKLKIDVKW